MARARTPTVVNELRGAYVKHPGRRLKRKDEPDTGQGIGPPPHFLKPNERKIWDEIVSICAPRVFQSSDRYLVAGLARLEARLRVDSDNFPPTLWNTWRQLLAACGMTPADRSRVQVPVEDDEKGDKPKEGLASFG